MRRVVVGLDTSCYTTSAAAVTAEGNVIASCRKLLPVPQGQRGLRQSEAVFTHVRQLPGLIGGIVGVFDGLRNRRGVRFPPSTG